MSRKNFPRSIPLPKTWTDHAKSAMLHIIALARDAITFSRGWVAASISTHVRQAAEIDRLQQRLRLRRDSIRTKDVRMALIAPSFLSPVLAILFLAVGVCDAATRPSAKPHPVTLSSTIYYSGDMNGFSYSPGAIDVDRDGTVALAANRKFGPGNSALDHRERVCVMLFDKSGEPMGRIFCPTAGLADVSFGPDGRIYTAENWFGAGSHVYDCPGAKERYVPVRHFKSDGSHVDRGHPSCLSVDAQYRLYTVVGEVLYVMSPEDKLLKKHEGIRGRVDVAPEGTVYVGPRMLLADGTWKDLRGTVRDIGPDGRLLVAGKGGRLGILDPSKPGAREALLGDANDPAPLEAAWDTPVVLPPGPWGDMALGPDGRIYLVPQNEPGLGYVVSTPDGKIVLSRGADFDRLSVVLPDKTMPAGQPVLIQASLVRSRDLSYVPRSAYLPQDNRPELALRATAAQASRDPLAEPVWRPCELTAVEGDQYRLTLPGDCFGDYELRLAATPQWPGADALEVKAPVTIRPPNATAYLTPSTSRDRTGFVPGQPLRIAVAADALADVDLSAARLVVLDDGREVWSAPLELGRLQTGTQETRVVSVPPEVTLRLRPGVYRTTCANLPPGTAADTIVADLVDPVRKTDFEVVLHPIGPGKIGVADARVQAQVGATQISTNSDATDRARQIYSDVALRLGLRWFHQPYTHFAAVHSLPAEQGAARQSLAAMAQRLQDYPAFGGFNYHDLWAPFGTWWDAPRKELYSAYWDSLGADASLPKGLESNVEAMARRAYGRSQTLPAAYLAWNEAVRHAVPRLVLTTQQWWHLNLAYADPDTVAADQDIISTQHMEEQYYHPATVAHQADLWRQSGKPLWVFGNATFQDDGSGAELYRELMTGLCRGVQGLGRNNLPSANSAWTERIHRLFTPAFQMLRVYGGLSAAAEPADQVAVWRSMFQESLEQGRRPECEHIFNTAAAYTTCLYAHRTANLVTDGRVRSGELQRYRAVIISFEHRPPADLEARLAEFQKAGGRVLANRPLQGYWAPPGAIELGSLFTDSGLSPYHNDDIDRFWELEQNEGGTLAQKLREALGDAVKPLADCDDPAVWISVLAAGEARYIFTVNLKLLPIRPADLNRYSAFQNTALPGRTPLRLPKDAGVIYDVLAGRQVEPRAAGDHWLVDADMSLFPGAILAILPRPVPAPEVTVLRANDHCELSISAELKALDATVPLEITVTDAAGKQRYHLYRSARNGRWKQSLPIAANDPAGRWQVSVRELLAGQATIAELDLDVPKLQPAKGSGPAGAVEWARADDARQAIQKAKTIALVVAEKQKEAVAPAVAAAKQALESMGRQVTVATSSDYLADRKALGWDKFRFGQAFVPELRRRSAKYDLIVGFDLPGAAGVVVPLDLLPLLPTATDPGPGRGLVQFVAMPVYDTEDGLSLFGGDAAGLTAAAQSLAKPPVALPVAPHTVWLPAAKPAAIRHDRRPPPSLCQWLGTPVSQIACSPDGRRTAVTLKTWGNNFFALDGEGNVLAGTTSGKFYPMHLRAMNQGFAVLEHHTDPTVLYLKLYDADGRPLRRLAAPGRRITGTADVAVSHPQVIAKKLAQASFSITPDGQYAAVGGSKAIAVWDLSAGKLLWRDDAVHHEPDAGNEAAAFPQVSISPDGASFVVQHHGRMLLRDGGSGRETGELVLPLGAMMGPVQVFDGHALVIGDSEFFGYRDGELQWWWRTAADDVTATAFAPDGLHYAIGRPSGAVAILRGGGQIGGYQAPDGGVLSLAITPDATRIAFGTSTGHVGVLDRNGSALWRRRMSGPAAVAFVGRQQHVVAGDALGRITRFDADGNALWTVNLSPRAFREDLASVLRVDDPVAALRLPAPTRPVPAVATGRKNLAGSAEIKLTPAKTGGWNKPIATSKGGGAVLNNGQADDIQQPWFDVKGTSYLIGMDYRFPLTWELSWKDPVELDTLLVREFAKHPEAVPEEIAVEAWVDEGDWHGWKRLVHDRWNSGVCHTHTFSRVKTKQLRYIVYGDFGNNLWTTEIEVYGK